MNGVQTSLSTALVEITCHCGVPFAISVDLYKVRKADHLAFYCPLGHQCHYPAGKTEGERLREQLDAQQARVEMLRKEVARTREDRDRADRQRAAAKGQVTKLKRRAANGVCPCCNRSFPDSDLQRHIATKHPDFVTKADA